MIDKIPLTEIKKVLNTVCVGKNIYYFNRVDSTNRVAKEYACKPVADGSVVVTDEQTGGRGRMRRAWLSSAFSDITCSIVLYPCIRSGDVFNVTMISSIAIVRAVEKVCGISADIKWPNDVYVKGKKLSGVLVEFSEKDGDILWVVAGIGINVNMDISQNREIRDVATSLKEETGKTVSRADILKALLEEFDHIYSIFKNKEYNIIFDEWKQKNIVLNRKVSILSQGEDNVTGEVIDIKADGTLLLRTEKTVQEIICGDLSLVFPARNLDGSHN